MRARILAVSLAILAAACTDAADEPVTDAPRDEPALALPAGDTDVPVASGIEVHQPVAMEEVPAPEPAPPPRIEAEPIGLAVTEQPAEHVHHEAAGEPARAEAPAPVAARVPGGGKPDVGVVEGAGLIPDRDWSDAGTGIIDDPDPIPDPITGRAGAVIIRGGVGRIDDDCAIHPRGMPGVLAGNGTGRPGGALVNDRDPRRGALINERAPRARAGGSMPRGAGFPGGGIRFR